MFNKIKTNFNLRIFTKCIIAIVISIVFSLLAEVVVNRDILRLDKSQKGTREISISDEALLEGFTFRDGKYYLDSKKGVINLYTPETYVGKLTISYSHDDDTVFVVRLSNQKRATEKNSFFNIVDGNNKAITDADIVVDNYVNSISIEINDEDVNFSFDKITYKNEFVFSLRRMVAIGFCIFSFLMIVLFSDYFSKRLELGFLVVSISVCLTMIFSFPHQKVSWDEGYHFKHAYETGLGNEVINTNKVKYFGDDNAVSMLYYPSSDSEFDQMKVYMDKDNLYELNEGDQLKKTGFNKISDVGHIASAIGISIGRLFKLPLSNLYILGKIFNALLYIIVTYFAIKHIKIGKRLLTAIALMPTTLFLAASYSYDATINAFSFLAISYIVSEFVEDGEKMNWKTYFIFLFSVGIVAMIKMVYAPLLLLLLAVPNSKFTGKKEKLIMKYGVFILCFVAVAIMIVPVLLNPPATGDLRGGETSYSGQLVHIFGAPVAYAKVLIYSIICYGVQYSVGDSIFGTFAHYGGLEFKGYITVFLIFIVLTDVNKSKISAKTKMFIATFIFIIVCFIWTALYISFTPVGYPSINGVQGRYFIPVVYLGLILFNTDRIKVDISTKSYNRLVLAVCALINFYMLIQITLERCV